MIDEHVVTVAINEIFETIRIVHVRLESVEIDDAADFHWRIVR